MITGQLPVCQTVPDECTMMLIVELCALLRESVMTNKSYIAFLLLHQVITVLLYASAVSYTHLTLPTIYSV